MYESKFAQMVLAYLPELPDGVDLFDEDVQAILTKLRTDAGVDGSKKSQALVDACDKVDELEAQLEEKKKYDAEIQPRLAELTRVQAGIVVEITARKSEMRHMLAFAAKTEQKLEEFFSKEPSEARKKFRAAVQALDAYTIDDFFLFRNHRVPPEFTRKIVEAICFLLLKEGDSEEKYMRMGWTRLQMIVADPKYNARENDEEALIVKYVAKVCHVIKSFNVFDHCDVNREPVPHSPSYNHHHKKVKKIDPEVFNEQEIARFRDADKNVTKIVHDSRYRPDSYYIDSLGVVAGPLVALTKTTYNYIRVARTVNHKYKDMCDRREKARWLATQIRSLEGDLAEVSMKIDGCHAQVPCRALLTPLSPASLALSFLSAISSPRIDGCHAQLKRLKDDRDMLTQLLMQAKGMVAFLESIEEKLKAEQPVLDYYEQLEVDLHEKHGERLAAEVLLREMGEKVVERMLAEKEKHLTKMELVGMAAEREAEKRARHLAVTSPVFKVRALSSPYLAPI